MKYFSSLLTLFLFSNYLIAQDQTNIYNIIVDGSEVGTLTATKQIDGDKTTYTVDSKSVVHLFGEHTITTSLVAIFRNGILESSTYTSEKNGQPYDSSVINETNGIYTINRKGNKSTLNSPIKNVTCQLYFENPDVSQLYFDVLEAIYSPITNSGNGTYVYKDTSTNETTTYTYLNSTLEQGKTEHALYSFMFTLKK